MYCSKENTASYCLSSKTMKETMKKQTVKREKKRKKKKAKEKQKQKRICKGSFIYDIRKKSINFVDVLNWH